MERQVITEQASHRRCGINRLINRDRAWTTGTSNLQIRELGEPSLLAQLLEKRETLPGLERAVRSSPIQQLANGLCKLSDCQGWEVENDLANQVEFIGREFMSAKEYRATSKNWHKTPSST